jgi:hypothetical protein
VGTRGVVLEDEWRIKLVVRPRLEGINIDWNGKESFVQDGEIPKNE